MTKMFVFLMALEMGVLPQGDFVMYGTDVIDASGTLYATFEAEVLVADHLFIGGEMSTYVWSRDDHWKLAPHRGLYEARIGLRFEPIEIGFRHYCSHPIYTYIEARAGDTPVPEWEGAYEELYVRLELGGR